VYAFGKTLKRWQTESWEGPCRKRDATGWTMQEWKKMVEKKPSLYEILDVSRTATAPEIKAAHRKLSDELAATKSGLSGEEISLKQNLLDIALNTLVDPLSRAAYDISLTRQTNGGTSANQDVAGKNLAAILSGADRSPGALDADSVSVAITRSASSLTRIMLFIAGLMAAGFIIQLIFAGFANRHIYQATDAAEDKVIIQEYYQEHGIRPASRAEVELLQAEDRRKEMERRQEESERRKEESDRRMQEAEKERAARDYQRFLDDSHRTAAQVSNDLQRAQERARYEDEQKKQKQEYENRQNEERERMRLQEERRRLGLN
jgi:curved DNA-binding protein CbpA